MVVIAQQKRRGAGLFGYTDTPVIPGQQWKVHDLNRPAPPVVTPGAKYGDPPSDAIVLFDGTDLSKHWQGRNGSAPAWKIENGYAEVKGGSIWTKEAFGDVQLHIEFASPTFIDSDSQDRGNSGIEFMGRYELQVLDSFDNRTYADGSAGSIYGQWPPMVNASRKPGEWQAYDVVFEAPKFKDGQLVKPAFYTVFHNGVIVQNRQQATGPVGHRAANQYREHEAQLPLRLQDHHEPVRYRNIWIRRLDFDKLP